MFYLENRNVLVVFTTAVPTMLAAGCDLFVTYKHRGPPPTDHQKVRLQYSTELVDITHNSLNSLTKCARAHVVSYNQSGEPQPNLAFERLSLKRTPLWNPTLSPVASEPVYLRNIPGVFPSLLQPLSQLFTSAKELMFSPMSVCGLVRQQDYKKKRH